MELFGYVNSYNKNLVERIQNEIHSYELGIQELNKELS